MMQSSEKILETEKQPISETRFLNEFKYNKQKFHINLKVKFSTKESPQGSTSESMPGFSSNLACFEVLRFSYPCAVEIHRYIFNAGFVLIKNFLPNPRL